MRLTRTTLRLAAVTAAGLVLSACSALTGDATDGLTGLGNGDVAARAGDVVVTTTELATAVDEVLATRPTAGPEGEAAIAERLEIQTGVLTSQLQVAIVAAAAEEEFDVVVTDGEVDQAVDEAIEAAGGDEAFDEALAAQGQSRALFAQAERVRRLIERVTAALVEADPLTDEDVDAALAQQPAQGEQVRARHILVETEAEAINALGRIEGGEDFGTVAAEVSIDTGSAQNGGDLGLAPRGSFVPEFEAAIWDGPAPTGELLGPVETQFGFHLIVVEEFVTTSAAELREQVRGELEASYGQDLFGTWVGQTLSDADPEVAGRFGRWDRTQQAVVRDDDHDDADL